MRNPRRLLGGDRSVLYSARRQCPPVSRLRPKRCYVWKENEPVKKLLVGLAIVVVLIIAAAVAVPFFIPLDTYKGKIVALVKSETGRDLRIDGPVHFSLLPSVALEANDVSLSNPAGATSANMVQLKTLDVELKLFPLLHGGL